MTTGWEDKAMYKIDPERLDLVEEFKANPFGPYGHELTRLVNRLRMGPMAGRYVLVTVKRNKEWVLGQLPDARGGKIKIHEGRRFDSLAAAEWAVFALRWSALTGKDLTELVEAPHYPPGLGHARR